VQENDIQYKNDVLQADYVKANGLGGSMVCIFFQKVS
jgi:hypothetical protein